MHSIKSASYPKGIKLKMNNVYIVGAGGFAREIYSYLKATSFIYDGFELAGFLGKDENELANFSCTHKVKGLLEHDDIDPKSALIMGIAEPKLKQSLYKHYTKKGFKFITYKHPTAIIGNNVNVGNGSIICPFSVLTADIEIGLCTTVNISTTIGHDATIGDFCTLSSHCDITGGAKLESKVFLGSRASILPNISVKSDSIVGAGSVVIKTVESGTTVMGIPARLIKKVIK